MGLFNINKEQANTGQTYDGQESGSTSQGLVGAPIQWNPQAGDEGDLVYKYPYNNIKNGAIVLPHYTQTAILLIERHPAYTSSERFVVDSSNIPLLNKYANIATGGETSYPAELWFVNTSVEKKMPWGFGARVLDSETELNVNIKANGSSMLKVSDPESVITKLVGTLHNYSRKDLDEKFRDQLLSAIRSSITKVMTSDKKSVVEMQTMTEEIKASIEININAILSEYGLEVRNFAIGDLICDDENYEQIIAQQAAGRAERKRLDALGVNYMQERQLDILQGAATNEGAGSTMGAGMGLGMGFGMGGSMGNMMGGMAQNVSQNMNGQMAGSMPPPIPGAVEFHVVINGQSAGPFNLGQLQGMMTQGTFGPNSMVWRAGMANWAIASTTAELAALFTPTTPPVIPPLM